MDTVKRTERGWAGHFCCAYRCMFRRNTLLEYKNRKIVVSTVGAMKHLKEDRMERIGCDQYYETAAFEAELVGDVYWDADVTKQISFDSRWKINNITDDADILANEMHENVVRELTDKMILEVLYKKEKEIYG